MIEAYDAANNSGAIQAYTILLTLIVIGLLIEFLALRMLRRYVAQRQWVFAEIVLQAIGGQALFWFSFFGLVSSLAILVPNIRLAGVIRGLLNLFAVLAIVTFLVRLITSAIRFYFLRHTLGSISLLDNVLLGFTAAVLLTTTLAFFGVPIGPLLTILAGSSIGLSLALREPLANLFSGITVLASNKIQPGDFIRLSTGEEGYVDDIRWSDTYIRELTNNMIVVPNALMTNTILTNFYRPEPESLVPFTLGIPYESDLREIERLIMLVCEEVIAVSPGAVPGHEPLIRFNTFGNNGMQCLVFIRVKTFADQFALRHEFFKRLFARFAAEGVPPPIPEQVLRITTPPAPQERQPAPESGDHGARLPEA